MSVFVQVLFELGGEAMHMKAAARHKLSDLVDECKSFKNNADKLLERSKVSGPMHVLSFVMRVRRVHASSKY